jgi:hypothetical protein
VFGASEGPRGWSERSCCHECREVDGGVRESWLRGVIFVEKR